MKLLFNWLVLMFVHVLTTSTPWKLMSKCAQITISHEAVLLSLTLKLARDTLQEMLDLHAFFLFISTETSFIYYIRS